MQLRLRPRRSVDPEATGRLADAWRAGNEERFWQILSHQLAVRIPEIGRQRVAPLSRRCPAVDEPHRTVGTPG
jgi:hypothetical protein